MTMWLGSAGARRILGDDENPSQTFPHPDAARTFAAFVLTGEGRKILETAGLTYLPKTR
ncbi:MAG: hypothetical protein WBE79_06555 [Candidatus Cybelea sp.]